MNYFNDIKVSLEIDDTFLQIGVKNILYSFFNKQNRNICFVFNGAVDLIIRTDGESSDAECGREILIKNKNIKRHNSVALCRCKNVISRHDTPEEFYHLLQKTMSRKIFSEVCYLCRGSLTRREKEILKWFSEGLSPAEIAKASGLSIKSVSQHKRNAMRKFSLKNTQELVMWLAINNKLMP